MAERAGCETPNIEVAGADPIHCKVLLIRGLFPFLILLIKLLFCRVLASVCEAQLRLCVQIQVYVYAIVPY